jgi:predicted O-methyltransferase YrrM
MNTSAIIKQIYSERTVAGRSGEKHHLHSAIDRPEGEFLRSLIIADPSIIKTLEVGCAYGLSSLYICSALQQRDGAFHTIIDPFQHSQWDGAGILNLEAAGIDFFELIEEASELALPALLENGSANFDLVFIDGFHTFDHALLDCFYATRLLRTGGLLVIDDASLPSVGRLLNYLRSYPCYEEIGAAGLRKRKLPVRILAAAMRALAPPRLWRKLLNPTLCSKLFSGRPRIVALRKIAHDERPWNWFTDAF